MDSLDVKSNTVLNINVPNVPWNEIKDFKVTRLGRRHHAEPVIQAQDPRGRDIYWVGPVGDLLDAGEGTDFHAVEQGYDPYFGRCASMCTVLILFSKKPPSQ